MASLTTERSTTEPCLPPVNHTQFSGAHCKQSAPKELIRAEKTKCESAWHRLHSLNCRLLFLLPINKVILCKSISLFLRRKIYAEDGDPCIVAFWWQWWLQWQNVGHKMYEKTCQLPRAVLVVTGRLINMLGLPSIWSIPEMSRKCYDFQLS